MLLAFQCGAVPVLEDFGEAVVVVLRESIKLDDARVALQDADLVTLCGFAPLRGADVGVVEGEGIAAGRWLPTETVFGESALAAILGKVKIDVIEAFTVSRGRNAAVSKL